MLDQSHEWRRALEVLASSPEGATEALLFAHGFTYKELNRGTVWHNLPSTHILFGIIAFFPLSSPAGAVYSYRSQGVGWQIGWQLFGDEP
jgi:hypothetical protein